MAIKLFVDLIELSCRDGGREGGGEGREWKTREEREDRCPSVLSLSLSLSFYCYGHYLARSGQQMQFDVGVGQAIEVHGFKTLETNTQTERVTSLIYSR